MGDNITRVVCWGLGEDFGKILPVIYREKECGNIIPIAFIDKTKESYGEIEVLRPDKLEGIDYEYIIVCTSGFFHEVLNELDEKKVNPNCIIKGDLLLEKGFDFGVYKRKNWLKNRIINKEFSDTTYEDKKRVFFGKNIELSLGNKSYAGSLLFEDEGVGTSLVMEVGNYSCISRNVTVEIALNLDHDYHRVTNYGMSHFKGHSDLLAKIAEEKNNLVIGSDVWIGRDSRIKSGIRIGDGAVVASNSYVVSDVPDYAIVGGNPSGIIKYRFDAQTITKLKNTQWWNLPEEEILKKEIYFDDPIGFIESFTVQ